MSELRYWVWLSTLQHVRARVKYLLLRDFGGVREVYFARGEEYDALEYLNDAERDALQVKDMDAARRIIADCAEQEIGILTLQDAAYPRRLAEIYDPPLALYVRGHMPSVDDYCSVAVVGTRNATPYGIKMAQQMGWGICKCGGMVISGLTRGVDAAAAHGAVMAAGRCVGVLGTAIDDPRSVSYLANDVMATGAVVSEYPPGARTGAASFRMRNRITSGLAVATLVVEAPVKSGALLFADEALSQGREVFAMPANADAENAAGSNRLIMEGAHPALSAWDVLGSFAALFPNLTESGAGGKMPAEQAAGYAEQAAAEQEKAEKRTKSAPKKAEKAADSEADEKKDVDKPEPEEYIDLMKQLEGLSETALAIVAAMSEKHMHVDDIIERAGVPAAEALGELTLLQIQGYVIQEPGKRFSLNIRQK